MRIIISSGGRRVYLVGWFRQALQEAGIAGDVIVLDHDPHAATAAAADSYRPVPAFTSEAYAPTMLDIVDELQPDLFISLNDYELTTLSQGLAGQLRYLYPNHGTAVRSCGRARADRNLKPYHRQRPVGQWFLWPAPLHCRTSPLLGQ